MIDTPIRLLVFCRENFPTSRVDVETLLGQEMSGRRGHRIDLVAQATDSATPLGPTPWHGSTAWVGATCTGKGLLRSLFKYWLSLWHDLRMLAYARADRYDAIQVRDKFLVASIALVVARARGLRFFYWLSFPIPESRLERAREGDARFPSFTRLQGRIARHLLYKWILPRAEHVFAQSERMRGDLVQQGGDAARIAPVPMGIAEADLDRPARAADEPIGGDVGELTLAYLGTLDRRRRLEMLVDMLQLLRAAGSPVRLKVIGGDSPGEVQRLRAYAERLGVGSQFEVTGQLPRSEALRHMRSADICLSPFFPTPVLLSTSPTKLVEYMAFGRPVIANDHPEQRRVLRASRGGVCVPWGARHFARAVRWLLARSAGERAAMGERGRQWVLENRTYERIAGDLEWRYRRLLDPCRRRWPACRSVLMVGTHTTTMGGISTVVRGYMEGGLPDRVPLRYVTTHRDGSAARKALVAAVGYVRIAFELLRMPSPLVHIHLSSRASYWRKAWVCRIARLFGRPYVLHVHGSEFMKFFEQECSPRQQARVSGTFSRAALVLALSDEWRVNLRRIQPRACIVVLPNAVPLPPPQALDRGMESGRILFLGRLGERKGTFDLVRAFAEIALRFPQARLVCAGDGAIEEVMALASELGVAGRVECPGWLSAEAARAELARADLFALPSYAEGLPMALLEAMAAGKPVVASSVGGIPSVIADDANGLLVNPGDPAGLVEALSRLLADAAVRRRLGGAARQTIEEGYSLGTSIRRLTTIYARFGVPAREASNG
jgi:glycosyltransferase involved in cell wall biosynthesis